MSMELPELLGRELLRYLAATSEERARLIGKLTWRNPGIADLLTDLEADDDLRARFEIELLGEQWALDVGEGTYPGRGGVRFG